MGGDKQTNIVNAPSVADEWTSCFCCGRSYPTINMVRFQRHADEALCVGCVAWLHNRSRPIVRKLYPIWQLPARIRPWITSRP
jgi:hypothetical protein